MTPTVSEGEAIMITALMAIPVILAALLPMVNLVLTIKKCTSKRFAFLNAGILLFAAFGVAAIFLRVLPDVANLALANLLPVLLIGQLIYLVRYGRNQAAS